MPDGVLNLLKPPGMTSHDLVAHVRGLLPGTKVGHTGTLDPTAAGVLVLCLGRATRLAQYISAADKVYRAEVQLGVTTDTQDAEGEVLARRPYTAVSAEQIADVLSSLQGEFVAPPPMYSAVRLGGRRLYELAREGRTMARAPRSVQLYRCQLLRYQPTTGRVLLELKCSKGTYVRSVADEIGRRLGCGAHLHFLLRTRSGAHHLRDSVPLEALGPHGECLSSHLQPPAAAVAHLPLIAVGAAARNRLRHGTAVVLASADPPPAPLVRVCDEAERLLCVVKASSDRDGIRLQPVCVIG